ncbi:MAG: putative membrane protein [Oceanospirillaceae bacterium]|jgi:uncharacterized membrane protein
MWDNRNRILNWAQQGLLKYQDLEQLMLQAQGQPSTSQWLTFMRMALTWLAMIAFCAGVIFFFAYNWQDMSRFSKFGLIEFAMLLSAIGYVRLSSHAQLKSALLMAMTLLTGALLAVIGQTYQTGADPWQLFAVWAVLMLPWALLSRSCILWILWVVIINTALALYLDLTHNFLWFNLARDTAPLVICILNSVLLIVFEIANNGYRISPLKLTAPYLSNRYTQQILVTIAGVAISTWAADKVFSYNSNSTELAYYLLWLALILLVYRYLIKDLYVIAASFLSFIIVSSMFLFDILEDDADEAVLLLISLYILGSSSLATYWLKALSRQFKGLPLSSNLKSPNDLEDDVTEEK